MAVGDAGLIDMPNGQRYVAGVVVKRPHNDPRAQELIRSISSLTYKTFSERPVPRPKPAAAEVTAAPESSDGAPTVPSQP
jgi:beta-lactamase class A